MATFIDKEDKKRAEFETAVAKRAEKMRIETERRLKVGNMKRRLAVLRLKVERAKDAKDGLEKEVEVLEQNIKTLEKTPPSGTYGSTPQSTTRLFETEAKSRLTATKQETAKKKVEHTARMFAEAVTKMKTIERELNEAKAELGRLELESRHLQEERAKGAKEKKKKEDATAETKLEAARLATTLRAKKNLLPATQRAYKQAFDEMESLQAEIRSLER